MKCIHCGSTLPDGKYKCVNRKCGMWSMSATVGMGESTVLLSDTQLSRVERIKTNLVDTCFGGGIASKSVALLAGDPGAGKTTLCLQLSDIFAGMLQREVLYIANEQHESELKETALRLELKNFHLIRVVKAMGGVDYNIGSLLLHFKPCLTVLDSVTKWSGEDMQEAVLICQRLKDYSVKLNAPTLVINQVTKSGDHAGLNQMQHAVDSTMMFEVWGENPEDPRRLHVRKNRHGPAPVSQFYQMTALGLLEITEVEALERLEASEEHKSVTEDVEDQDLIDSEDPSPDSER